MRGRIALQKLFVQNLRKALALFVKASEVRTCPLHRLRLMFAKQSLDRFPETSTRRWRAGAGDEHGNHSAIQDAAR